MKSIRRRLTIWLLGGLAILWIAAGAGIYLAVREGLLKSIDAELAVDARIVRFATRGDDDDEASAEENSPRARAGKLQERMPAYHEPGSGVFFQMWTADGEVIERSASLGEMRLVFPEAASGDPVFATARLEDGRSIRTMSFRIASGGKGKSKGKGRHGASATITVVAKDMSATHQTLMSLLGGIAVVGLIAAGGAILLVRMSLRHGLMPLRDLGEQTESIDASSLDARFDAAGAPVELRPVYERLNDLIDRLETGFDRERRFSSNLAHEMRTPVAELRALSEVALKWPDQAGADTHSEALDIAHQLESMIENLLALARLESGEMPLKNEPVDIEALSRQCWEPYSKSAAAKEINIRFNFDSARPVLRTDPDMMRHILDNLLSNAAEYTPEGGLIRVFGHENGIEVANTAPELKETDVERLFERYWRRDPASGDGESNHTGLGLSLARACAGTLDLDLSARLDGEVLRICLIDPHPRA